MDPPQGVEDGKVEDTEDVARTKHESCVVVTGGPPQARMLANKNEQARVHEVGGRNAESLMPAARDLHLARGRKNDASGGRESQKISSLRGLLV